MNPVVPNSQPLSGVGVGLRAQHYREILEQPPQVGWFEVLSDNYLDVGGLNRHYLEKIRRDYPVIMHSVGMSIGSTDPLDAVYLKQLRDFANQLQPVFISDHLCWSSVGGHTLHDLIPIPYNEEAITHIADRICRIQDFLGRQITIENVSSYLNYKNSTMPEWEFLAAIVKRADCGLLCDVNNIVVSSINHQFDPYEFIRAIPADRVRYCHLAGFRDMKTHVIDSHSAPIDPRVWQLYRAFMQQIGPRPTLIEWDLEIPPFATLVGEARKAKDIIEAVHAHAA